MLANRFRVVALAGRGGMGEVYRVDDLKLGQPAALKFLPPELENDADRLTRFINEVRMALKVSHPNVCRVHDVSEIDGRHYLSMEFVDGDDLASLLKQVGRFPQDKAVDVARQICAGLAAAHDEGILHRDLKPANVMINGRGQVKLTDFGLAAPAQEMSTSDVRAGTPQYMAPEQFAGQEATVRTDIYALGLVLFELFTGKAAFPSKSAAEAARRHGETTPTSPTTLVDGLDPAVERVIMRCLEKDPALRPASARAVAAALPGGDPLAAALAAGETPSPELVAEAGHSEGLSPARAWLALLGVLATVVSLVALDNKALLVRMVPLEKSSHVLHDQARTFVQQLGYLDRPTDSLFEFQANFGYVSHLGREYEERGDWDEIAVGQPAALLFNYRQSPEYLERNSGGSLGGWMADPPPTLPGMIQVGLDTRGRLRYFHAVPPDTASVSNAETPTAGTEAAQAAIDWTPLFAAAGFQPSAFEPVEPKWTPSVFADTRAAWEGVYPDAPDVPIRIEAAAFAGRPVIFQIIEPWTRPAVSTGSTENFWQRASQLVSTFWFVIVLVAASLVAWRNVRLGRGDRKTALRLSLYLGGARLLWLLGAHHIPTQDWLGLFTAHMAWAAYRVCLVWIFYLAFEPYARRLWPHMMVSWVRLFDGRVRDPLVGRHLLVGLLFGVLFTLIMRLSLHAVPELVGLAPANPEIPLWSMDSLRGTRFVFSSVAAAHTQAVLNIFVGILMFLMLRLVLRRTWLAVLGMSTLAGVMFHPGSGSTLTYIVGIAIAMSLFWFVFFRFGFLSLMVSNTIGDWLGALPLTFDVSAWYFGATLVPVALVVGLTIYAFYVSLAGRPLFHDSVFEAESPATR